MPAAFAQMPSRLLGRDATDFAPATAVGLETLLKLRWLAIAGQIVAVETAQRFLGLELETGALLVVIGASVLVNLAARFLRRAGRPLGDGEVGAVLLFDIVQVTMLIGLTGGLSNPTACMVLLPLALAATLLPGRGAAAALALAVTGITFVGLVHMPLVDAAGARIVLPPLFTFGHWTALVSAAALLTLFLRRVASDSARISGALKSAQQSLARERQLTELGGLIAATAHELGTPLATIKLAASELAQDLPEGPSREDAVLIRDQADRCSEILRSMGTATASDPFMLSGPVEALLLEAARPHEGRGKTLQLDVSGPPGVRAPQMTRAPGTVRALGNIMQNAFDFARAQVRAQAMVHEDGTVTVRISDDGPGYPPGLLERIGEPGLQSRRGRPGYDGMGLGLFIARTLLERSGATVDFDNAAPDALSGAAVSISWPPGTAETSAASDAGG